MNRLCFSSPTFFVLSVKTLIFVNLIGIAVLLDALSSKIGLSLGYSEAGNALFGLEFLAFLGLAVLFYKVKKPLAAIPVAFAFLPCIHNFMLIGGII